MHNNSQIRINKQATEEFFVVNSEAISNMILSDKSVDELVGDIKNKYKGINEISIIKGRNFIYSTDSALINEKITKDVFDSQREMQKKLKDGEKNIYSNDWLKDNKSENILFLYPVIKNNKVVGSVIFKSGILNLTQKRSIVWVYILALLAMAFMIYAHNKNIAWKKSLIALVWTILIVFSILMIINSLDYQLKSFDSVKTRVITELNHYLANNDIDGNVKLVDFEKIVSSDTLHQARKNLLIGFWLLGLILISCVSFKYWERFVFTFWDNRLAYFYILPALFGVLLLVFFPFTYGFLIGFTDYNINNFSEPLTNYFTNIDNYTIRNFINILKDFDITNYENFYFTLIHNIIWTILNVVLHVSIGVGLALILNDATLKGRTFFRIIYILPWAVPSYLTALIWKGMFHKQFGAVNGFLNLLGFESISWFLNPITAFLANLATNVWLGFPFMMVVALGALQSIPKELYEAADIDGATKWQGFWNVTFPLLKPAMIPSIILGTIWTFNQFNVIYLVSRWRS